MTLPGAIVLASWFGAPIGGYVMLRRAGRTVLGALAGAALLWAIAGAAFLGLSMVARNWGLDIEAAAYALPLALAYLVWKALRRHAAIPMR